MTVPSTQNRNDYDGNGTTAVYAYTFRVQLNTQMRVIIGDLAGLVPDITLNLGTDYTITGVGSSGGNVTIINATYLNGSGFFPTGKHLTLRRVVPLTQTLDIRNQGPYNPESVEDEFDLLTFAQQQIGDQMDRSIRLPQSEVGTDLNTILPNAVARASKVLGFDSSGNPIAVVGVPSSSISVSSYILTLLDDGSATIARGTLGFTGAGGTVATAQLEDASVTNAKLFNNTIALAKIAEAVRANLVLYGASATGTDDYAIDPATPFTAYVAGMIVSFKADVSSAGPATLNVSGLGVRNLRSRGGLALGNIKAGDVIVCVFDGADFLVVSDTAASISHEVFVTTGNGHGSTNNKIRRFTTLVKNVGTGITYADSATLGASFTINEAGCYAIAYNDLDTEQQSHGVSVNSVQLTTSILTITNANRLAVVDTNLSAGSGQRLSAAANCVTWLAAGDVVRPHTAGTNTGTSDLNSFRITKIS